MKVIPKVTEKAIEKSSAKYSTTDHKQYLGVNCNCEALDSGVYRCHITFQGEYQFNKVDNGEAIMLKFPSEQQKDIIEEIKDFWGKKDEYKQLGLTHKRGVLLYGDAGGGKTSVINILIEDLIKRDGIVIDFKSAREDIASIQFFRKAEPNRPLMVIMEDIDALFGRDGDNHESAILNLLDGVLQINNVVYLATSNYPEKLAARITNRPSRFDRVAHIGPPADIDRHFYIKHLLDLAPENKRKGIDIDQWVKDTNDLSVAHLKELVLSVVIYGNDYKQSLHKLDKMKHPLSANGPKGKTGF